MACPVYTYKARSREVYFPAGTDWYDFYSDKLIAGGAKAIVDAPLEQIPLFVPAGSILPIGPVMQYASEKKADNIEIRVYRGKDGKFSLYEDEGVNYNYEKGAFSTISFEYNDAEGTLTIGGREGSFEGMLTNRIFSINTIGKSSSQIKTIQYNGSKTVVRL
jgi:alpha-D-xyloside xylohydrolase